MTRTAVFCIGLQADTGFQRNVLPPSSEWWTDIQAAAAVTSGTLYKCVLRYVANHMHRKGGPGYSRALSWTKWWEIWIRSASRSKGTVTSAEQAFTSKTCDRTRPLLHSVRHLTALSTAKITGMIPDWRTLRHSGKNLSQCHSVHYKLQVDCHAIEPSTPTVRCQCLSA
jgi:hypothetical protein